MITSYRMHEDFYKGSTFHESYFFVIFHLYENNFFQSKIIIVNRYSIHLLK